MYYIELTKGITNLNKLNTELRILNSKFVSLYSKGTYLQLAFSSQLTQPEVDAVSSAVNNFIEVSITEQLKQYVEKDIKPFVENLLFQTQAENIAMGITQLNKTADVLGFFEYQVVLPGKTKGVSLKGSLDTNSLTVTVQILNYYIETPSEYADLSPFITVARLTSLRDAIVTKLSG
jgi:hypothetical protein